MAFVHGISGLLYAKRGASSLPEDDFLSFFFFTFTRVVFSESARNGEKEPFKKCGLNEMREAFTNRSSVVVNEPSFSYVKEAQIGYWVRRREVSHKNWLFSSARSAFCLNGSIFRGENGKTNVGEFSEKKSVLGDVRRPYKTMGGDVNSRAFVSCFPLKQKLSNSCQS